MEGNSHSSNPTARGFSFYSHNSMGMVQDNMPLPVRGYYAIDKAMIFIRKNMSRLPPLYGTAPKLEGELPELRPLYMILATFHYMRNGMLCACLCHDTLSAQVLDNMLNKRVGFDLVS